MFTNMYTLHLVFNQAIEHNASRITVVRLNSAGFGVFSLYLLFLHCGSAYKVNWFTRDSGYQCHYWWLLLRCRIRAQQASPPLEQNSGT